MRDEILKVLNSTNKKLGPIEIMDSIKKDSTREELRELIHELDLMCRDGILRCASGGTYILNDLLVGKVDLHEKGNAHIIIPNHDDVFVKRDMMMGALNNDTVSIEITDKDRNEGKIVKVLKRSLGKSLGEVVDDNGRVYVKLLDDSLPYEVEVENPNNINLVDGLIVHLEYIRDLSKRKVLAYIDYEIGHKNAVGNDTVFAMIGSEFGRRVGFPPEVLEEAKKYSVNEKEEDVIKALKEGRVGQRGETIVTIDGKDTKDIDDAINTIILPNGNYKETVSIADVTDKVPFDSAIWRYAEEKGNSDYWGNKVAPMLPIELSNGICSLNPNEDRFAVTVEYELDHAGNIINPNVFLGVIKSEQKMNYDAVEDIIEDKETEDTKDYKTLKYTPKEEETLDDVAFKYGLTKEELLEYNNDNDSKELNIPTRKYIKNHYVTAKIMEDTLRRNGKIDFDGREPKYIFDENDEVVDIQIRVQRPAEKIIECKMLYANMAFAQFMVKKLSEITSGLVPFVFRTHGSPNPKKIEEFLKMLEVYGIKLPFNVDPENISNKQVQAIIDYLRDEKNFSAFNDKLLRCMQKARYTPENYGHYGVGSDLYCHFTSPIRRMADLLVHLIFKVFVVNKNHDTNTLKFWGSYLEKVCEKISMCEVDSEQCEYAIRDYLNSKYMEKRLGTMYEASVDTMFPNGFFARTDKLIDGKVDFFLDENDSREVLKLKDPDEIVSFVETHKKVFNGYYDYNEKLYGYSRNGRMYLRFGDRVLVCCTASYPDRREIDFTLVRKL